MSIIDHLAYYGSERIDKVDRFPTFLVVLREERPLNFYNSLLSDDVFQELQNRGDLAYVGDLQVTLQTFSERFRCDDGEFLLYGVYKWCEAQVDSPETLWTERIFPYGRYRLAETWYEKTLDEERDAILELLTWFGAKKVELTQIQYKVRKQVKGKVATETGWIDDRKNDRRIEKLVLMYEAKKIKGSNVNFLPKLNLFPGSRYFTDKPGMEPKFTATASSIDFLNNRWTDQKLMQSQTIQLSYGVRNRCRNDGHLLARRLEVLLNKRDISEENKREYVYEDVEKTLSVNFATIKIKKINDKDWEMSNSEKSTHTNLMGRIKEDTRAFLLAKRPFENAFNGIRNVLIGPVNSGKSTLIYSILRALSGELSLKSHYVRNGPEGLHMRRSETDHQAGDGTKFGAGESVFVHFYPILHVDYRLNNYSYEGYLAMLDTQGLTVPANSDDGAEVEEDARNKYKKTLKQKGLTIKKSKEEVHTSSSLRYLYSCFYNIIPDLQIFVIDANDFLSDRKRFVASCRLVKSCHDSWEMTRYLPDGFVVVLSKRDLFYKNGGTDVLRDEMIAQVGTIFTIPLHQAANRIFFIENHRKPTDDELINAFQNPAEYKRKYIERNNEAINLLQSMLTYARQYRDDEATLRGGERIVLQMQKVVSIGIDYSYRDTFKYDVFLSYHQNDTERIFGTQRIRVIQNCIHALGLRVYTDFGNRDEATEIRDIMGNVQNSKVFVAILIKNYFSSKFCLAELLAASTGECQMLTIGVLGKEGKIQVKYDDNTAFDAKRIEKSIRNEGTKREIARFYRGDTDLTDFSTDLANAIQRIKDILAVKITYAASGNDIRTVKEQQEHFVEEFKGKFNTVVNR